jgi:hypothetical protein
MPLAISFLSEIQFDSASTRITNVVTSQLRCSCDRGCLHFVVRIYVRRSNSSAIVQLLLLVYFVVDKTGAVLRSDNFVEYKIVVASQRQQFSRLLLHSQLA